MHYDFWQYILPVGQMPVNQIYKSSVFEIGRKIEIVWGSLCSYIPLLYLEKPRRHASFSACSKLCRALDGLLLLF